ncbi:MAG: cobalamin biosynthesis protein CobQ [Oscillospiraceae bacterium]|nr:cobalamin biosynthesis protein CobQ [Oscillospiraceae bacterium]
MNFKKVIVITGHYGSGKTNISANLALFLSKRGKVSIVDLDIVNAYFRTADFRELFADRNISLIASKYANSSLDVPALGFDVAGAIRESDYTIIDVGGDPEGARALGRYKEGLIPENPDMLYVVNQYRYLTRETDDALNLLREIEHVSGLKCTGIINNSNLGTETTSEIITASLPYAQEIAEKAGVPLVFTAGKRELDCEAADFPVEILVKPIWQK